MNDTQSNTSQSTTPSPFRAELMQTLQRCAEAYHRVMADMPKDPNIWERERFQAKGYLAFCSHLPVLIDPASFQIYFACVSQGAAIGAIDTADAGRLCHIANSASAAWKLANLIVPAAEEKDRLAKKKEKEDDERRAKQGERAANPLPPNGNQSYGAGHPEVEKAIQEIIDTLPTPDVQKQFFQVLRERGHALPGDGELYRSPIAALHFIRIAKEILREEALAQYAREAKPASRPAAAPPAQPTQAA